ncbi:MAG: hypothetical protein ACXWRU_18595 [Pseudobdellovibrionaceae bacterium]
MKFLFLIATLIFSSYSFAEKTQDLSKMLADGHCIPIRGVDGNISGYNCEGQLSEKMKDGKFERLGAQKVKKMELKQGDVVLSANGEPVDTPAKAMELYNSMKDSDTRVVQRPATLNDQIKSCLAGIYFTQMSFRKSKGTFTTVADEFGLNRISNCKGLDVSADFASQNEFKVIARAGGQTWSVDQSKTIEQVR